MAEILIIDDQDRYAGLCRRAIPEHRYHGPARCWADAQTTLKRLRRRLDLVMLDVHFDRPADELLGQPSGGWDDRSLQRAQREQGLHILAALRRSYPELPVILMTSRDDLPLERAADEFQAEEYTYFLDDDYVDASSLRSQIEGIVRAHRGVERDGPIFWGRSPAMRRIRDQLLTLARGRLPVVLGGPTGTGKSLLARHFVHPRSGRKGRFVAVDLSTLPRDLVAAQLFGSTRGSYTGSVADRKGAFEEADGGVLFLDEIGNMPVEVQKMLLTVLQEGAVTRIGDLRERRVDVKLVAATNEDLPSLVRAGTFRSDLFMRLNPACTVELPPLSERLVDLPRLVQFGLERALAGPYLRELVQDYRDRNDLDGEAIRVVDAIPEPEPGAVNVLISARSMNLLRRHPWPGNLREFTMTLENALVFTFAELARLPATGGRPDVVQIRPKLLRDLLRNTRPEAPSAPEDGWQMQIAVRAQESLNKVSADVERQYFTALYLTHGGDFQAMARILMGDPDCARKVQLRFNQLGLKVRELRARLG